MDSTIRDEQRILFQEYIAESIENLDLIEPLLIQLEVSSGLEETGFKIQEVYQNFHTLKGGAGFLGLSHIETLSQAIGAFLQIFRNHPEAWQPQYTETCIQCQDLLREMLKQVELQYQDKGFEQSIDKFSLHFKRLCAEIPNTFQTMSLPAFPPDTLNRPDISVEEAAFRTVNLLHRLAQKFLCVPGEAENYQEAQVLIHTLRTHYGIETSAVATQFQTSQPSSEESASDEMSFAKKDSNSFLSPSMDILITPELMETFIEDTLEYLEKVEQAFLVMEKSPSEAETEEYLQTVFGCFHTIKGNSGFIGLHLMEHLSHKAESVLEKIQEKEIAIDHLSIPLILEAVDTLKEGTIAISNKGTLNQPRFEAIELKLGDLLSSQRRAPVLPKEQKPKEETRDLVPEETLEPEKEPSDVEEALPVSQSEPAASTASSVPKTHDIRVNLEKLEQLIALVGELIISDAMISQHLSKEKIEAEELRNTSAHLHQNMLELQEVATSMRMIPVAIVFRKMIRLVRDASRKLGKQVELKMSGEDTEVDKTLVEHISEPLLHVIRNAVDHGIELPEVRKLANKPTTGTIHLEAKHVSNEVWIVVKDDGSGLNRDKIIKKARAQQLLPEEGSPSDEEVWRLIFEAGFSTAEQVTDFSGRGVGMDVVRRSIEKLRGNVQVQSQRGRGTTFTMRIPLTLSIIDGLLVDIDGVFYALATTSVREIVSPESSDIRKAMNGTEMLNIRGHLIPILRLPQLYGAVAEKNRLEEGVVLVIENTEQHFCLFVNRIIGQQQIVIKGLPKSMTHVPHLSGCTILGDGEVGLILDTTSLSRTISVQTSKASEFQKE
ncbi:chemotaxis protein CheA [Deltaproteobacteria bacterium TL4]